jgi:tetrahydromethanopterin S-methyltransferase subunit G
MPDDFEEIRQRLSAVEEKLTVESGLRAMMDLDQATLSARLDAQDNLLRALSITQSEHTTRFRRLDGRLTSMDQRLTSMDQRLTSTDQRLTSMDDRLTAVDQRTERIDRSIGVVLEGMQAITTLLGRDEPTPE